MDGIFEEEKSKLKQTKAAITNEVKRREEQSEKWLYEFNNFSSDGFYASKPDLQERYKREEMIAARMRAYLDEPYFGRMDLDIEGQNRTETYYIGKEGININAKRLVIDWRSELGKYFYMKAQKEFSINEYAYQLVLRRSLEISHGELKDYNTEYDINDISLEGDVMDPFLITVLRDKRRQNKLTDIIKTIQSKQNDIIRLPRDEEFILQGCAGSGKTMILLHRLSYLKFNNRSMNWNIVKIITPNKAFDTHINELSNDLELNDIERLSVEEYYIRLIKGYSEKLNVNSETSSEKTLDTNLLRAIYSIKVVDELRKIYCDYWNEVVSDIMSDTLLLIINRYDIAIGDITEINQNSYYKLITVLNTLKELAINSNKKYEEYVSHESSIESHIGKIEEEKNAIIFELKDRKDSVVSILKRELANVQEIINQLDTELDTIAVNKKRLHDERKRIQVEVGKRERIKDKINQSIDEYTSVEKLIVLSQKRDDIAEIIVNIIGKNIYEVKNLQDEYIKIPMYQFMNRNAKKQELDRIIKEIDKRLVVVVNSVSTEVSNYIDQRGVDIVNIDNNLKEIIDSESSLKSRIKEKMLGEQTLGVAINVCSDYSASNKMLIQDKQIAVLDELTNGYFSKLSRYYVLNEEEVKLINRYEETKERRLELSGKILTKEEEQTIKKAIESIEKLSGANCLNNTVIKYLKDLYSKHGVKYTKTNYRHKLLYKLMFCSFYFPNNRVTDRFLNIDEAQDISILEYRLIKSILGSNCIFNLYGDVNQLVYDYKGIIDWKELEDVISPNIYVLNENYRNTIEITNYCNKEFGSNVFPIGIAGTTVENTNINEAVKWIIQIKRDNPDYRCAIIYRYGIKSITEKLEDILNGVDVSWFEVDDNRISIISVELSKGLEFEAVVAIAAGMTVNEKYVSFTRALSLLQVVKDEFFAENILYISDDTQAKEIDDDMFDANNTLENDNGVVLYMDEEESPEEYALIDKNDNQDIIEYAYKTIKEAIGEDIIIDNKQKDILLYLNDNNHVACNAPAGNLKSIIFWIMVSKKRKYGQSIITSQKFMQENELVNAERFGLKVGYITNSIDDIKNDVKRDKYDVIFVPFEFFDSADNISAFERFFSGKITFWGIDHPLLRKDLISLIFSIGRTINTTFYLMTKEGFADIDLAAFKVIDFAGQVTEFEIIERKENDFSEKIEWLSNHLQYLEGRGIIYCNDDSICRSVSKAFRKKRIKAPEYIDNGNEELIHYLTNSFIKGGIPIIVSTHELGRNLSNPDINFIIHFDMPADKRIYDLHLQQISRIIDKCWVINFG